LGLVAGMVLVIVVAVVFFRREAPAGSATSVEPVSAPRDQDVQVRADGAPVPLPLPAPPGDGGGRLHTVQDGETLGSVARHYYLSSDYSSALYRANRDRVRAPDQVVPGTVLRIPDRADLDRQTAQGR
jgi:nucleoid-associated protein YgaU